MYTYCKIQKLKILKIIVKDMPSSVNFLRVVVNNKTPMRDTTHTGVIEERPDPVLSGQYRTDSTTP